MTKNIQDAEDLEDRSRGIKENANQFMRGSSAIESEMKARNRRLNIIII